MKALVIGAGNIGTALVKALAEAGHTVRQTTRAELDLSCVPDNLGVVYGDQDVVYICAAKTKFIDCEADPEAYQINVDGPVEIARQFPKVVYLSSEAVERALHTNYGMHKALAEIALRAVCRPVIARISKVDGGSMRSVCAFLIGLATKNPGVYKWRSA